MKNKLRNYLKNLSKNTTKNDYIKKFNKIKQAVVELYIASIIPLEEGAEMINVLIEVEREMY